MQFQYQRKNTICKKNMRHDIIFSMFELFSLLVPFSPLEYLLYKKYCTTMKGVHSASCKNIASWPRPHLFPHWPASFTLTDLSGNTCLFSRFKRSCMEVVHVISLFWSMLFILFLSNYDWQLTFSAVIRMIIFIKVAPVYTVVAL